jgi:DNA modification methylase
MGKQHSIYVDRHPVSIIDFTPVYANKLHPTQKPEDLIRYLVRTYTLPGETVLDNCIGSGTTAVAAVLENRKFIGFEISPEYCEIANKRLRDLTGPFRLYGNIGV